MTGATTNPSLSLDCSKAQRVVALGSVIGVVLIYNVLFFNKYLPVSEAWFLSYAHLLRDGQIPYRDFYLLVPPLYVAKLALVQAVFGEQLLIFRMLGVVVVVLIAVLTFLLLALRFSPLQSAIAAIVATVYYQSGVAHIGYDFIQFVTLYALAALLLLCVLARAVNSFHDLGGRHMGLLAGIGFLSALAALTKHSNGGFVLVFMFIGVLVSLSRLRARVMISGLLWASAGAVVPFGITFGWLATNGVLGEFFDQVVRGAISAKGTPSSIVFSWIGGVATPTLLLQLYDIGKYLLPLVAFSLLLHFMVRRRSAMRVSETAHLVMLLSIAVYFALLVVIPYATTGLTGQRVSRVGRELLNYAVVVGLATYLALIAAPLVPRLRSGRNGAMDLVMIGIVGLGLVWGNGTSAGVGEVSMFLGLAVFLCAVMALPSTFGVSYVVALAVCSPLVVHLASAKFDRPYAWWSLRETDARFASEASTIRMFRGMRLSQGSKKVLEETARLIQEHSSAEDEVLAFPDMPIFNLVTGRWPGSPAIVQWFDFLPDDKAVAEAKRIELRPPKMILYLEMPESVWVDHERLFRAGRKLGQREIRSAIERLTSDPARYVLDREFVIPDENRLTVWHRVR